MGFSAFLAGTDPVPFPLNALIPPDLSGKGALFSSGRFDDYIEYATPEERAEAIANMPLVALVNDPSDYDAVPDEAFFNWRFTQRFPKPDDAAAATLSYSVWRRVLGLPEVLGLDPLSQGVAFHLNDQQEAMIGCGRFYGTDCDIDGFDFLVGEGSALFQSWPGFEGTEGGVWLTDDSGRWQPGTAGFDRRTDLHALGGRHDLRAAGLRRRDSSTRRPSLRGRTRDAGHAPALEQRAGGAVVEHADSLRDALGGAGLGRRRLLLENDHECRCDPTDENHDPALTDFPDLAVDGLHDDWQDTRDEVGASTSSTRQIHTIRTAAPTLTPPSART